MKCDSAAEDVGGPVARVFVMGAGFAYLPFFIYRGFGTFRFENTWADVSCFFTEGYGFGFLLFATPALALTTFLRELLIYRSLRQRT